MATTFAHEDAASASGDILKESLSRIVHNKIIDEFLREDRKCYIIGPKGTGKTLLLSKKAIEKYKYMTFRVLKGDYFVERR